MNRRSLIGSGLALIAFAPVAVHLHNLGERAERRREVAVGQPVPEITPQGNLAAPEWYFDQAIKQDPRDPSRIVFAEEILPRPTTCTWQNIGLLPDGDTPSSAYLPPPPEGWVWVSREPRVSGLSDSAPSDIRPLLYHESVLANSTTAEVAGEPYLVQEGVDGAVVSQRIKALYGNVEAEVGRWRRYMTPQGKPGDPEGNPLAEGELEYFTIPAFCGVPVDFSAAPTAE